MINEKQIVSISGHLNPDESGWKAIEHLWLKKQTKIVSLQSLTVSEKEET